MSQNRRPSSHNSLSRQPLAQRIVESLYTEAMVLADEARAHFDPAPGQAIGVPSHMAVLQSCESLKVTTRLMHCIAWLLNRKAYFAGEMSEAQWQSTRRELGVNPASDPAIVASLPPETQSLIVASENLHMRIQRLSLQDEEAEEAPVISLWQERIREAF